LRTERQQAEQIEEHNHNGLRLNAAISLAPVEQLRSHAITLDEERAQLKVRGPLHGIPILIKDNIMTEASLGMDTTCGSYALKGAKAKINADVVDLILKAGMIILGKANLSVTPHL
jgi:amidase